MVVDRSKSGYTLFYRPTVTGIAEYQKSGLEESIINLVGHRGAGMPYYAHTCPKVVRFLRPPVKAKVDVFTTDASRWTPFIKQEQSVENRLERLEKQFNNLMSSTWVYLFGKRNIKEMKELSRGMLEDSKKMQELAVQLQGMNEEG